MLKLSFLSRSIKKLVTNKFVTKEFHKIIKLNSNQIRNIQRSHFSELNKPAETKENKTVKSSENKIETNENPNQKFNSKEEILKNLDLNIDAKLDSISAKADTSGNSEEKAQEDSKQGENKNNKASDGNNNKDDEKVDEEIEKLSNMLTEIYGSKMSFKQYKTMAVEYKEKLNAELIVNF
jgi:hypothetical protein